MEAKGIRKEAYVCDKYVAGKSTDEVMADYGLKSVVKLGSNENMYAPYPEALKAMQSELNRINIYPEKNYVKLKELIAEDYGVTSDWVSLGHGAGNVLDEVAKTYWKMAMKLLLDNNRTCCTNKSQKSWVEKLLPSH